MEIENGLKLKAMVKRLADSGFTVLISITMIAVLVPLSPGMPGAGLDPSWVLGMNEAVARGMAIGTEIIFTFGPYASVYTRQYHPGTDHLMVGASTILAMAFTCILRALGKQFR
ncbi:MAG: hypothetical protein H6R26_1111, partial [Proteobacteria bacterium]|nr:hypothetical protein [Pseudomonadota bacterium]